MNATTANMFAASNEGPPPVLPGAMGEELPAVTVHLAGAGSVSLFRSTPGGFDGPGTVWLSVSPAPVAERVGAHRRPAAPAAPAEPAWMDEDPERWDGLS